MRIYLLLVMFFLVCCSSTSQIIKTTPNNPRSYVFDSNILQVKAIIKNEFLNKPGYRYMQLEYSGQDIILSSVAKKLFENESNQNDFYLHYSSSIGKSKIAFDKKENPLDYYAEFHLHLTAIDSTHTKVEVFTIDPKVVVGRELLPSLPHLVRMDKTKSVPPSTIEEYEILLKIGKGLNVGDKMPKLIMP